MKKIFISVIPLLLLMSCGTNTSKQDQASKSNNEIARFGDSISEEGAIETSKLETQLAGKDSIAIKLTGKITDVCQKKGCWMMLDLGNNNTMRVTFKDYAFFVPKDAAGKTAIVDGYAYTDTTSVAQLKHYAEDAKKSKAEIDAITAPEINTSFEARGVIIK